MLVTVLYRCEGYLERYFQSLARQTDQDFALIAIDNASPDKSASVCEQLATRYGIRVLVQKCGANLGVAEGNNVGLRLALSHNLEHIVLSNNDIDLPDDTIARIRSEVIDRRIPVWAPKALYGDSSTYWYAGGFMADLRGRSIHTSQAQAVALGELAPYSVTYAPTCFMYVHADVFRRVGIMDKNYFVYHDDTDFSKRLQRADIPIRYDPTLVYRHYVGSSSGGDLSPFFLTISTRNKFYYIRKHFHGPKYYAALLIGVAGKAIQLLMPSRAKPTWKGLRDARRLVGEHRDELRAGTCGGERELDSAAPGEAVYVNWN